jgi:hypothetical protein
MLPASLVVRILLVICSYDQLMERCSLTGGGSRPRSGLSNVINRAPSPTDEDLFDEAIAGLAYFDMDGDVHPPPRPNSSTDDGDEHSLTDPFDEDNLDQSVSFGLGKRQRSASSDNVHDEVQVRKAIKIQESKGRPKAADYEPSVHTIFSIAWPLYRGRLCTEGPMPDRMQEVSWAKLAWTEACERLGTRIACDAELIKMVCHCVLIGCNSDLLHRSLPEARTFVVRSRLKSGHTLQTSTDLKQVRSNQSLIATSCSHGNSRGILHLFTRYAIKFMSDFSNNHASSDTLTRW